MTERWLPVPGFEGFYQVSDQGRVRAVAHRHGSPRSLLAATPDSVGYRSVKLRKPGVREVRRRVHRLVAAAFIGPCPPGQEVRHLDGDKLNCLLVNLAYGTRSENQRDTVSHGNHNQARKTHCDSGHEFTEANTYRRPSRPNRRDCRQCNLDRTRARRAA